MRCNVTSEMQESKCAKVKGKRERERRETEDGVVFVFVYACVVLCAFSIRYQKCAHENNVID